MNSEVTIPINQSEKSDENDIDLENKEIDFGLDDLDTDLQELRLKYAELKKEREKSERDEQILANKMKLLAKEEINLFKKQQLENQYKENFDKIRENILQEKELLDQLKKKKETELNYRKLKASQIKENKNIVLKTWRNNLSFQNQSEAQKVKLEKNKIQEIITLNKEEINSQKKYIHDKVQINTLMREEKKSKKK